MTWNLSDVTEAEEQKRGVELNTFNMLDLFGDFIKSNHSKEEFEAFAAKWCDEHAEELGGVS